MQVQVWGLRVGFDRRVHPPTAHTPIPPKPKFNFNINLLIINIILYFIKFWLINILFNENIIFLSKIYY